MIDELAFDSGAVTEGLAAVNNPLAINPELLEFAAGTTPALDAAKLLAPEEMTDDPLLSLPS